MVGNLRPLGPAGIEDAPERAVLETVVVGVGAVAGGQRDLVGMSRQGRTVDRRAFTMKALKRQGRLNGEPAYCRPTLHPTIHAAAPPGPSGHGLDAELRKPCGERAAPDGVLDPGIDDV